ncbi:MAG: LuxR C-terminal-related transcriptional regulator [Propionicimonas sp.]|uniref:LuxR C-terminal-related transcriptional regulator n=1 Tax=Propionicimonas sp. TaxID=1955623 RepID=UPI002B204A78|nr:LuxR C-terminal-related transcriptional regulator [Propionicimonas sp.]MEA4943405.1 LuxR C-terminal-related transcriptional regulator [Propionicimonas sp.]MEA5054977.1 LuxR C-terminal-related transcriptional regulator [Propionicimonas sp.]MEA5118608.1 LuxR C-terminal-related transcriptional regulator [Propionicimonas sp.]
MHRLIGEGKTTVRIAREVHLVPSTVKYHITRMQEKLGAVKRVTLAIRAHELGIYREPERPDR